MSQLFAIRWPKYWSFSVSISPSHEYSELISSSIDWFDLLAVEGTLKSLLQHHSLKASILWWSAFFMVLDAQIHPLRIAPFYRCVHLSSRDCHFIIQLTILTFGELGRLPT